MKLPTAVAWPESQVLFLLIGGKDNFRRHQRMRYQDRGSGERPGQDWCRPLQEAERGRGPGRHGGGKEVLSVLGWNVLAVWNKVKGGKFEKDGESW